MAILDDVKLDLRISSSTTAFDSEITDIINACKIDMGLSGVLSEDILDSDALIKQAIKAYVKANFGLSNQDSNKYNQIYQDILNKISMTSDYAFYKVTFTVVDSSTDAAIREAKVIFMGYSDTDARLEQIKYTDENGQCIFYVRSGSNYKYSVSADGYSSDEDDNNLVDVSASTGIEISLTEV